MWAHSSGTGARSGGDGPMKWLCRASQGLGTIARGPESLLAEAEFSGLDVLPASVARRRAAGVGQRIIVPDEN